MAMEPPAPGVVFITIEGHDIGDFGSEWGSCSAASDVSGVVLGNWASGHLWKSIRHLSFFSSFPTVLHSCLLLLFDRAVGADRRTGSAMSTAGP